MKYPKKILETSCFLFLLLGANMSYADAPICHPHNGAPYCAYYGKVSQIYVNTYNTILLYFDTSLDLSSAQNYWGGVIHGNATSVKIDDNPEFAKLFYSTALSAQATGRKVSLQMRGQNSGYLAADRIWLSE
jgi:hypothetical protein